MSRVEGTRVVFRVDASLRIGSGHVMRCLALATALRERGARCSFVCRDHPGQMLDVIAARGFAAAALPRPGSGGGAPAARPAHAAWLDADPALDAAQTLAAAGDAAIDWLVVDHYAIDAGWEQALRSRASRLLVIDDLADRPHGCELLVDQSPGRVDADYAPWTTPGCRVRTGPRFALLRPEFAAWRARSLARRASARLDQVLVTLGGSDPDNVTGSILDALVRCPLPADTTLRVVMGASAPALDQVRARAAALPWPTQVLVGVDDMASLMATSDIAIGAAGTTALERCCLGLPSVLVVLAANQAAGARALADAGAAVLIEDRGALLPALADALGRLGDAAGRSAIAHAASQVTDGAGTERVVAEIEACGG